MGDHDLSELDPGDFQKYLRKVVQSRTFADSPRCRAFLEFIGTQTLAGSAEAVKESVIASEVFSKDSTFDPRSNTIVRTTANRLRTKLSEYYAGEGAQDTIEISLVVGGYVPVFKFRSPPSTDIAAEPLLVPGRNESLEGPEQRMVEAPLAAPAWLTTQTKVTIAALLISLVIATVMFWYTFRRRDHGPVVDSTSAASSGRELKQNRARRSIAILGFKDLSGRAGSQWLAPALSEMFQTEMSASQKLRAVPGDDIARLRTELQLDDIDRLNLSTLAQIHKNLSADVIMRGHYIGLGGTEGEKLRLDLELIDTSTGEILSSVPETGTEATLFGMIAHAASLLRLSLGVDELSSSELTQLRAANPSSLKAEQLYAQGLEKLRRFDAVGARQMLKQATDLDPNFALAHLGLADTCIILGYEAEASREASKAASLSGPLPREQYLWIRGRDREIAKDWRIAIDTYRSLWMFFPDQLDYGLHLIKALTSAGEGKAALTTIDEIRGRPRPSSDDPRIDLAEAATFEGLGDFKREKAAAARAAQQASLSGSRLVEAAAELRACWALNNLGDRKPALALAERARSTYHALGDRGGEAQALKNIADALDDQGDHGRAKLAYEAALTVFRQIGYETGAAVTLNNLAYACKNQGDLAGAKKMFEESLAITRRIADRGRSALPLSGLGGVLWRQGDLAGAKKMYGQALSAYLERNDQAHAATVIGNLGLVLEDEGHLREAQEKLEESLAMQREIDNKPEIARTLGNIGELLLKQGNLAGAKREFDEHLALGRAISDEKQIAYALHELGEVHLLSGNLNEARRRLEEALERRTRMGEAGTAAETRMVLAELLLEQQQFAAAESMVRTAIEEFHKEGEADTGATARGVLARCLSAESKTIEAQQVAEHAIKAGSKSQDRGVRIDVLIGASRATAEVDAAQAIRNLRAAASDANRYGYYGRELEARVGLAEIQNKTGGTASNRDLARLEKEAKARGFGLIARHAAAARSRYRASIVP